MSIKSLNPYILFNGTAEKAIKLYESALGAKTEGLSRFGDAPAAGAKPEHKSLVMHAALKIGEGVVMISDTTRTGRSPRRAMFKSPCTSPKWRRWRRRRCSRRGRQGSDGPPGHVLGRKVWDADGRLRRALDVQLRSQEELKRMDPKAAS